MSQPAWKAELSRDIEVAIGLHMVCGGAKEVHRLRDHVLKDVMPHIEAAFKRGEDAAKLREGSRLVQENERLRRELRRRADEDCPCVLRSPEDYDGPAQDCPKHGDPAILGYDPSARRERYMAAINGASGWVLDGGRHMVDAVLAVADRELNGVHKALDEERDVAVRAEAENARLRAELEQARTTTLTQAADRIDPEVST
ncbi:hypothetical protein ACFYYH_15070 [Streptomyces sp. NPDC002018]|uniref:hypothetical protein n=1 Tax=Streptomyces sp. NPDC002018 TaxID=3364629 RepID=UPI0036C19ABF